MTLIYESPTSGETSTELSMNNQIRSKVILPTVAIAVFSAAFTTVQAAQDARVIDLTQTACQFVESEGGIERGYNTTKKADCDAINAKNGAQRVTSAGPMVLKPGSYIFRVTNRDVPYELGFWLRSEGLLDRLILPSVSGGGMTTGKTQDYAINLKPGEYLYSCPLNTTPDYRLIVKE